MIDVTCEKVVRLRDVPALDFMPRRNGRKVSFPTLWRWCTRGLAGGRKLEVLRMGGQLCTSIQALQRFFETTPDRPVVATSSVQRDRQIQHAERELDELMGGRP